MPPAARLPSVSNPKLPPGTGAATWSYQKERLPMLTTKLLAALGIAGALMIGAAADANANPFRGGFRASVAFRAPMYRAPMYRAPFFAPRPVVVAPAYAPTYAPVYQTPVVYGATYAPAYRPVYGVGWRHPWVRGFRRW
jgi:hypothetical protein